MNCVHSSCSWWACIDRQCTFSAYITKNKNPHPQNSDTLYPIKCLQQTQLRPELRTHVALFLQVFLKYRKSNSWCRWPTRKVCKTVNTTVYAHILLRKTLSLFCPQVWNEDVLKNFHNNLFSTFFCWEVCKYRYIYINKLMYRYCWFLLTYNLKSFFQWIATMSH